MKHGAHKESIAGLSAISQSKERSNDDLIDSKSTYNEVTDLLKGILFTEGPNEKRSEVSPRKPTQVPYHMWPIAWLRVFITLYTAEAWSKGTA